jgi:hypothetical protein
MITQLSYKDSSFSRTVNNAVLVVDASGPVTGKTVFERFRFAWTRERIVHDLMDQPVYSFEHVLVRLLPVKIVLPGILGKDQLHSASLRVFPPPRSSSATDSRRRLAFFGTRRRYAVSSSALKSSRESITTDSFFCLVMMTGSWSSHTFFIVDASRVRAAEYVIVAIIISYLYCTNNCTIEVAICQEIKEIDLHRGKDGKMEKLLNTLFVTTQGAYLSKDGETVVVNIDGAVALRLPVHTLGGIICFGQVSCSPYLMGFCAENQVAVSFLTENGSFLAKLQGPVSGNLLLRHEQYRRADDLKESASIARAVLTAKLQTAAR